MVLYRFARRQMVLIIGVQMNPPKIYVCTCFPTCVAYVCMYACAYVCMCVYVYVFLFNDALNTFLINGYIGVGNILCGKIPSGYLPGIDLRSTACQTGAYTTRLPRRPLCVYVCMCICIYIYIYVY